MGYIISISLLYCLAVFLPNISCLYLPGGMQRIFWRKTDKPPTLLPPPAKHPEFYRKLREDIPPKNETAKKVITNILRIRPGVKGKRQIKYEDTVIVMDGSGSVGRCEFDKGKKAMKNIVGYVQSGIDAKYGMVTFASNARRDFDFQSSLVAASKMDSVSYPGGSTNTQAGLQEALNLFKEGGRGLMSDKFVLLLTDGQSNVNQAMTVPNAQKLKNRGVKIFVVAVGGTAMSGIEEMVAVASFPPKEFLFRVKRVQDFLQMVNLALKQVDTTYAPDGEYDPPCS